MTDDLLAENVGGQGVVDSSSVVSSSSDRVVDTQKISSEKMQEKMLRQSEVNDIVGSAKRDAYEKGKRDSLAEYQKTMQNQSSQGVSSTYNQSIGGVNQLSDDKIRQMINEESQKMTHMAVAQKIAQDFTQKMMAAKDKYPDFENTVSKLNLPTIPEIVNWANSLDNTADVMYEIAKHPSKFAQVLMLARTAPHLAVEEMQRLSDSIKSNDLASKQPKASEPLSQVRPSTTGTDNGSMTVTDYRKQSWLRG